VGLFGVAIALHALWNGVFTVIDSRIFVLETLSIHTVEVIAYVIVTVVSLAIVAAIPLAARRLRDAPPPPVEGTALATMAPWLG
jgi:hypothetical protein